MEKIKKHLGWHYLEDPKHLFFTLLLVALGVFGFRYSISAYSEMFEVGFALEKTQSIAPDEPVTVKFSQAMFPGSFEGIRLEPRENARLSWDEDGKKMLIYPERSWKVGEDYKIFLPEGRSRLLLKTKEINLGFSVEPYPKIISFSPVDGSTDVVLDMEEPLEVSFDRSTANFLLRAELDPQADLTFEGNADKTQIKFLPKSKLEEGKKYTAKVYIKYKDEPDNLYWQIYSGSFETLPPPPETWEKDHNLRILQAKKYTQAKKPAGKYIDVNISQQILSLFEDGKIVDSYMISSGKRGMETPKGEFSIHNKAPRVWSKKYGLYMPFWMAVASDGSFGFHELPEWPGGYKEGAAHLGIPVSHGCIRLGVGSAKRVFEWTEVGTPVVIY